MGAEDAVIDPLLRLLEDLKRYAPLPPGDDPSGAPRLQSASVTADPRDIDPVAEVIETVSMVFVTVELPGTGRRLIDVRAAPDDLDIQATVGERRYNLRVVLPAPVRVVSVRVTERNGVLDVSMEKDPAKVPSAKVTDR